MKVTHHEGRTQHMKKLIRFAALSLIVAATTLPASAARRCSCDFCQTVDPTTACTFNGNTTCGAFLAVTLCPAG
jgi:hypothetical protein